MNRSAFIVLSITTCMFIVLGATPSLAVSPSVKAVETKMSISQSDAEKIALAKVPGGVIETAKLEMESKKQIWSVDVKMPESKNITEVHIDALSGKVLSVQIETPEQQAKEAEADRKKMRQEITPAY